MQWLSSDTVFRCSQKEFSPKPQMSNKQLTKWGRDQLPLDYYNVSSKPAFGGLWVPVSYSHCGVLSILFLPGPCVSFLPLILLSLIPVSPKPSLSLSCLCLGFFHGLLCLLVGQLEGYTPNSPMPPLHKPHSGLLIHLFCCAQLLPLHQKSTDWDLSSSAYKSVTMATGIPSVLLGRENGCSKAGLTESLLPSLFCPGPSFLSALQSYMHWTKCLLAFSPQIYFA